MEKFQTKTINAAYFATPELAVSLLCALSKSEYIKIRLVVTQADKKGDRERMTAPPIKNEAERLHLPVLQPTSLTDPAFVKKFKKANIDVCILFAYGSIIPATLLDIPPYGWVNVHPSLLPKYRGASPIQWTILNGDTKGGISLIQMDEGIDTGPLIDQWAFPVDPRETATTLSKKVSEKAALWIPQRVKNYCEGTAEPYNQATQGESQTRRLTKADGHINWSKNASKIGRRIRAYTPWPGTYSLADAQRIKILEAVEAGPAKTSLPPGTTEQINGKLLVHCGNRTTLQILRVQKAGKAPQSASEFLRGFPTIVGIKLT